MPGFDSLEALGEDLAIKYRDFSSKHRQTYLPLVLGLYISDRFADSSAYFQAFIVRIGSFVLDSVEWVRSVHIFVFLENLYPNVATFPDSALFYRLSLPFTADGQRILLGFFAESAKRRHLLDARYHNRDHLVFYFHILS